MDLLKEKLFSKCNDKFDICETQSELGGDIEGTRAFHEFCVLYGLIELTGHMRGCEPSPHCEKYKEGKSISVELRGKWV